MSTSERIVLALALGIASAGLGAAFSLAMGTAHVWPGTAFAFGFATFTHLTMSRRWAR